MSLEWARARLLERREALRKLHEALAAEIARHQPPVGRQRGEAALIVLPADRLRGSLRPGAETGTLLRFEQRRRRRRA